MEFLRVKGQRLYAGGQEILLRGFGLGGWFLPEGYMWKFYQKCDRPRRMEAMLEELCGKTYSRNFWKQYLDTYITEADIKMIAEQGFNSVRLPLNSRHLDEMLDKVDELIGWCRKWKIYVILDMHGAPGGQTGQNIDDSEKDLPELFTDRGNEEKLLDMWAQLAQRYAGEPAVAAYDLLNEPLPEWFSEHNDKLLPLYRRIIQRIRAVDKEHIIMLEGAHWATDFTIFSDLTQAEAEDQMMLQFHKYWSHPDEESLKPYLDEAERLQVPLIMGEGGENNVEWYTTIFPLYERLHISWSFWSYKKIDCTNSPMSFGVPAGWDRLIGWLDGGEVIPETDAVKMFDDFLYQIGNAKANPDVLRALKRELPVTIPAEAYDRYEVKSERKAGADIREGDPVTILFANGKTGEVDYKRYGGEPQPEEENLVIELGEQDKTEYRYYSIQPQMRVKITGCGTGVFWVGTACEKKKTEAAGTFAMTFGLACVSGKDAYLELGVENGVIQFDDIMLDLANV